MINKDFTLKIITPHNIIYNSKIYMLIIPSVLGEMSILSGHEPLITNLEEGIIKIILDSSIVYYDVNNYINCLNKNKIIKFFICSAIVNIDNTSVRIITDKIIDVSHINENELSKNKKKLKEDMVWYL